MRKRYSEEQIVKILQELGTSGKVAEGCRKYGISDATYYNWKKRYEGLGVEELRRLRVLEEENRTLKKLLAEQLIDNDALKALLKKNVHSQSLF